MSSGHEQAATEVAEEWGRLAGAASLSAAGEFLWDCANARAIAGTQPRAALRLWQQLPLAAKGFGAIFTRCGQLSREELAASTSPSCLAQPGSAPAWLLPAGMGTLPWSQPLKG